VTALKSQQKLPLPLYHPEPAERLKSARSDRF
jgi:hypothetical protein